MRRVGSHAERLKSGDSLPPHSARIPPVSRRPPAAIGQTPDSTQGRLETGDASHPIAAFVFLRDSFLIGPRRSSLENMLLASERGGCGRFLVVSLHLVCFYPEWNKEVGGRLVWGKGQEEERRSKRAGGGEKTKAEQEEKLKLKEKLVEFPADLFVPPETQLTIELVKKLEKWVGPSQTILQDRDYFVSFQKAFPVDLIGAFS
ncbi:unnamed protein product [Pleuronectes platessa]|uniref:Uncharacterized protein n=1 Tax=Pleuronectes platessa TaxID=8262 RepID=A0A9N7UJ20_PLEPL|nr:unnamed protein product [Pleuronectes platessa]